MAPAEIIAPATDRPRLDHIDALRACAALMVGMLHLWGVGEGRCHGLAASVTEIFVRAGRFGVDLFIVVSGFCLMLPVVRSEKPNLDALGFFWRRAKRILPPYYCALALSAFVDLYLLSPNSDALLDTSSRVTVHSLITHLLLIHDAFASDIYKINGPLWSIAVEWRIYFFFPLLLLLWRLWGPFGSVLSAVIISSILMFAALFTFGMSLTIYYLGLFSFGMLACAVAYGPSKSMIPLRRLPWNAVFWASLLLMLAVNATLQLPVSISDYEAGCCSAALLVASSRSNWPILEWGPLVFVGTYSYSVYLMLEIVVQIVWRYAIAPLDLGPATAQAGLFIVGLPIILASAYIFFVLFERPFIRKVKVKPSSCAPVAKILPAVIAEQTSIGGPE